MMNLIQIQEGEKLKDFFDIKQNEKIFQILAAYERNYPVCSIFQINRRIEDFSLEIYINKEEYSHLWDCPQFITEVNFRDKTIVDIIQISVGLKEEKFREIVEMIVNKSLTSLSFLLSNVNGSPWNPSLSTHYIKILTTEHEVEIPKEYDIKLLKLDGIGKVCIVANITSELVIKPSILDEDYEELNEDVNELPLSTSEYL